MESVETTTTVAVVQKGPPPPVTVEPDQPEPCHWTRHTRPATEVAPWSVEYVTLVDSGRIVAYLGVDGEMKPLDWERHCSTVTGPSP